MKKLVFLGLLIAFGSVAHADTIYQVRNIASDNSPFPPTPANLPDSSCQGFDICCLALQLPAPHPEIRSTSLRCKWNNRIFLEAAAPASVLYGHTVNNIGPISSFNNLGPGSGDRSDDSPMGIRGRHLQRCGQSCECL